MAVAGTGYMNSVQDSAQPGILNTMNKLNMSMFVKRESCSKPLNYVFLAFLDHRFEINVKIFL